MKQLEPLLDTRAMTCSGKTVAENLAGVTVANPEVIRPRDRAFSNEAPITILRGSLAPESAICKLGLRGPGRVSKFDGPAIVFDNGPDAIAAIQRGEIKPGHALIVRGMGPKGGPGMAGPASMVVFAVDAAGLQNEVAFISDGQLSGLCNKGLTVAEVSPESAIGGPLALVETGDRIVLDVDKQQLDLVVPEAELAARRAAWDGPKLKPTGGWLGIYQRQVQPMSKGAVLVEK